MKARILILVMLTICSSILYGQNERCITSETNEFYCKGWLFELPDTIMIFTHYDSIPKLTKYSEIKKNENENYELFCWTGEIALESPTQLKERLKIKFKDSLITFKFGESKSHYIFNNEKGKFLLIKIKTNMHRF